MNYTITVINGHKANDYEYATLCPICNKHFIFDNNFDTECTDTAFISAPRCTICKMRFSALYCYCDDNHYFFDGFHDLMTNEYIPCCDFPDKAIIPVYTDKAVITACNKYHTEHTSITNYTDSPEDISDDDIPF